MKRLLALALWVFAVLLGIHLFTGQISWLVVFTPILAWLALFVLSFLLGIGLVIAAIVIVARRDHIDATAASKFVGARAATKGTNPLKGDLWRKGNS